MEAIDRIGDRRPAMTVNSITICIGWWGSIVCAEECESWANRAVSFFSIVVDEQSTLNYVNTRVWVPSTVNNGPRFLLVVQFCWRCPKFFSTACQFCNYNELYMHWRSPWVSSTVFRRLRINEEVILRSPKHYWLITHWTTLQDTRNRTLPAAILLLYSVWGPAELIKSSY